MTAIASRHDVTTRVWQHTRVIWYNPMTSQQYNGVASNFLIQQQHCGLFGDDIVLLTFRSLRQDWVQSCHHLKWGDYWLLLVGRVLELAPPQESWWSEVWILFPVSCRICFRFVVIFVPSEETEHITDHHHFIILTLWVKKNYKKCLCVKLLED